MRRLPSISSIPSIALALLIPALVLQARPAASATGAPGGVPSPEQFLGHKVGEDRFLAPWPKVVEYLRTLDAASDRISIETAGYSTQGNEMPLVIMTSAENQKRLDR